MWTIRRTALACIPAFSLGLLLPDRAAADHRRHRTCADADIECLRANLVRDYRGPALAVGYEVEIEDAAPCERFDLVLRVTDCGRSICDPHGRPLILTVPLTCPSRCGRDRITFRNQLVVSLPQDLVCRAGKLRVDAKVVALNGKVLDCDDVTISICR